MNNYRKHAMAEFKAAKWLNEDESFIDGMQEQICNHILALLDLFADEGHSGSSAPYTIDLFSKLAKFEPIAPLTGEDDEWENISYMPDEAVFQNKRCSSVFKTASRFEGKPYYISAVVFYDLYRAEDGTVSKSYYTTAGSSQVITFPWVIPETIYRFVPTEEFPTDVTVD